MCSMAEIQTLESGKYWKDIFNGADSQQACRRNKHKLCRTKCSTCIEKTPDDWQYSNVRACPHVKYRRQTSLEHLRRYNKARQKTVFCSTYADYLEQYRHDVVAELLHMWCKRAAEVTHCVDSDKTHLWNVFIKSQTKYTRRTQS